MFVCIARATLSGGTAGNVLFPSRASGWHFDPCRLLYLNGSWRAELKPREEPQRGGRLLSTGQNAAFQDRTFQVSVFSSAPHSSGRSSHRWEAVTETSRAPAVLGLAVDLSSLTLHSGETCRTAVPGASGVFPLRSPPSGCSLFGDARSRVLGWLPSSPGSGVRFARVSWVRHPPSFKQIPLCLASLAYGIFTEFIPIILVPICLSALTPH